MPGVGLLIQPPAYADWSGSRNLRPGWNTLTWKTALPSEWSYLAVSGASVRKGVLSVDEQKAANPGQGGPSVILRARVWARPVRYFAQQTLNKGPGLHVAANCDVAAGKATNEHELWWTLRNRAGPNDGPELVLGASVGTACVSAYFGPSGSYLLGFYTKSPTASSPEICLWQLPLGPCLSLPGISPSSTWRRWTANLSTNKAELYLYAPSQGKRSVVDYGDISIYAVSYPAPVLLAGIPKR